MSLLTLRGKGVQAQWKRRRRPALLWCPGSFNCHLPALPSPPQLASPSPPVPLEVALNHRAPSQRELCSVKKASLCLPGMWTSCSPSCAVSGYLTACLPVRLHAPTHLVQLGPWVLALSQRCGHPPSKVLMWGVAWRDSSLTVKLSLSASVSPRCQWLALAGSPLPLSGLFWLHQGLGDLWLRAV